MKEVKEQLLLNLKNYSINFDKSVSLTRFPKLSFTYFLSTVIVSPALSVALKLISSSTFSIIVCSLLAPIFSTEELTSADILANISMPSSVKTKFTLSVFNNSLYCFIKLLSGSFKILLKSSSLRASSSTLIGNLPCNSGNKSEGLAN